MDVNTWYNLLCVVGNLRSFWSILQEMYKIINLMETIRIFMNLEPNSVNNNEVLS